MSTLFAIAWRNVLRHRRRSILTAMAMAISVVVVSAIMVLTEGMYGMMREIIIDENLGHLQVHHPDYPGRRQMFDALDRVDETVADLEGVDGVVNVAPRLFGQALLGAGKRTEGAQLLGIDPVREARMRDLSDRIVAGAWLADAPSQGLVLGDDLAKRLKVEVGAELVAVTQAADGSLGNDLYTVVGVVDTGVPALDRGAAFIHRETLGELLALQDKAHELVVLADSREPARLAEVQPRVEAALASQLALVRTWSEVDPTSTQLFAMQSVSNGILLFLFFGVSAVGVVNTLLMSVLERTKELGVMRALGMRPGEIIQLVMAEALILATLAIAIGLVGAGLLNAYLVVVGLDLSVQGEGFAMANMTFDPIIKGKLEADAIWQPVVGVFLFSVFAAIWPATRASRLRPVDALREA